MKKLSALILISILASVSFHFLLKPSGYESSVAERNDVSGDEVQHANKLSAGSGDRAWMQERGQESRPIRRPQRAPGPLATEEFPEKVDAENRVSIPLGPDDVLTPIPLGPNDVLTEIFERPEDAFSLPPGAVVQTASDFTNGQMENLVIDGGLRLKPLEATGGAPDDEMLWGTLQSPEFEAEKPFAKIKVTYEGSRSDNTELNLDFRVRFENGAWSDWQEASWDFASDISLSMPASGWQYRVTMSATDISHSPQVDRVIVIPQYNP